MHIDRTILNNFSLFRYTSIVGWFHHLVMYKIQDVIWTSFYDPLLWPINMCTSIWFVGIVKDTFKYKKYQDHPNPWMFSPMVQIIFQNSTFIRIYKAPPNSSTTSSALRRTSVLGILPIGTTGVSCREEYDQYDKTNHSKVQLPHDYEIKLYRITLQKLGTTSRNKCLPHHTNHCCCNHTVQILM